MDKKGGIAMQIVVLNGSPKGAVSVTMQYVGYLQKVYPQHQFQLHHVAQRIKRLERNEAAFAEVIEAVKAADAVLWAFPVYYLLVSSQYKRFIELIHEREVTAAFAGTYAASLSTSIHFFDHTAHNYIRAVSEDLGMRFVGSFSPHMHDLLKSTGQAQLRTFGREFLSAVSSGAPTTRRFAPLVGEPFDYQPAAGSGAVDPGDLRVQIISDARAGDHTLQRMIDRFRGACSGEASLTNLRELDITAGCQGCLHCAYDNECALVEHDGYVRFYEEQVKTADVLVLAGTMVDRYLSARWKLFYDRSFYNGHVPTWSGKQVVYLISGRLSHNANLAEILTHYPPIQGANVTGTVTDEGRDSALLDRLLDDVAGRAVRLARAGYIAPLTFPAVGGRNLFRDEIWGWMRNIFRADHRIYKQRNLYEFPRRTVSVRMQGAVMGLMMGLPATREVLFKRFKSEMIRPFEQVLVEAE
jgi:multimeric flavodoxin WrbA